MFRLPPKLPSLLALKSGTQENKRVLPWQPSRLPSTPTGRTPPPEKDPQEDKIMLPDDVRSGGIFLVAPSGHGKSKALGRSICYQDAKRARANVVLDVSGHTSDYLFDKLTWQKRAVQERIWPRVRYLNMAGLDGFVPLWPLLQPRQPNESLYTTSQRLVDLFRKIDVKLADATIYGLKRLSQHLTPTAQILTALNLPITYADDLLTNPKAWLPRLDEAVGRNKEAYQAARELTALTRVSEKTYRELTEPLRNRLGILKFDQVSRVMFGAPHPPTIAWETVARRGYQVYIDFRHETSLEAREFKLFWVWNSLLEYIRLRSRNDPPLGLVIDEVTYFVRGTTHLNQQEIVKDFHELILNRKRNANLWLTIATQEQAELPEEIETACMSMGNLFFGPTTDEETALARARRWGDLDPYKVKDTQLHFGIVPRTLPGLSVSPYTERYYGVTGETKQFMPLKEQEFQESKQFQTLPPEDWFFARSRGEGHLPDKPGKVTTRNLDPGRYVNEKKVSELRQQLMHRDGVKIDDVVRELDSLQEETGQPKDASGEEISGLASSPEAAPPPPRFRNTPRRTGKRFYVEGEE